MPLGAFRINSLAKFTVTAVAEVIRRKKSATAISVSVSTAQSQFGGASMSVGSGYLQIADDSSFSFGTGDFTIEFWYRPTSLDSTDIIWDQRPTGSQGLQPTIYTQGQQLIYYTNVGNRITGSNLSLNTWHHIAVSRSGTSTRMFINGTQTGSTYTDSNNYVSSSTGIRIGSDQFQPNTNYAVGHIDEIRVSRSARYTANFTVSTTPFTNDSNTLLLIHCDGTNASTYFEDDNGQRTAKGMTAFGNAQIDTAQSRIGGASALFDGNGDYLQLATSSDLTFSGNFTIECWYRLPGAVPGIAPFFFNDHLFYLTNDAGVAKYAVFAGGNNRLLTTTLGTISANTWYHVAFQRNGSTLSAYHNGTLISSSTYSSTMTSQTANYIGFYPGSTFFNGHIDEFRISNTARYSSNFTPSTTAFVNDANTVLLIHADGTDATTVFTDDNGVRAKRSVIAFGNAQIDTAQSQFSGASALFDGTSDYLQIPAAGLNLPGDFTIEFWARHAAVNDQQVYFDFRAGSTDHIIFYIRSDNRLEYYDDATYTTTNTFAANTWYHMALSRSSGTLRLFVNGTQQWSNSNSRSHTNAGTVWIGTSNDALAANSMNGHIDEFRVSNTARYTANFTAPTAPFQNDSNTLLLLHMDGTDALTVFQDDNGVTPTHQYS